MDKIKRIPQVFKAQGLWLLFVYRFAFIVSSYSFFVVLQGVGHNVATIVTGKYFDGFAGGYTGIGLLIIGSAMIYYLLKGIQTR